MFFKIILHEWFVILVLIFQVSPQVTITETGSSPVVTTSLLSVNMSLKYVFNTKVTTYRGGSPFNYLSNILQ